MGELMDLMRNDDDEDIWESFKKAKDETKKSKATLDGNAEQYNQQYKDKIEAGTRKRRLMLEQAGVEDGTSASEEIFKGSNEFMPTIQTPILNFLHFLSDDYKDIVEDVSALRDEYDARYGTMEHEDSNVTLDMTNIDKINLDSVRELHEDIGDLAEDDFETTEAVPHMETYIYKNMDAGTFGKLKKLKALSHSDNEQEAHAAWQKCMELCEKFDLKFESIPCNTD